MLFKEIAVLALTLARSFLVLAVFLGCVDVHARCDVPLADPNAGGDVCAIVKWLYALPKRSAENRIMSGQYGWQDARSIHEITGSWPALYEDYLWQKGRSTWDVWPDAEANLKTMKEQWDAGGLVSVHMPIPNPKNKSHQHDRDLTDEEFRDVTRAGTHLNNNYLEWLGRLADRLARLQDYGVTIFIRPLHEMNHRGFWYGLRAPEDYRRLFHLTVDFLVNTRGLHNLIIVYAPNTGKGLLDYYPGEEFVDVVGVDTYRDPPIQSVNEYLQLKSLGKPFVLTEVGWDSKGLIKTFSRDASADIISAIKMLMPDAVGWSSWSRSNSPSSQIGCRDLYADPMVMTRDEVNWKADNRNTGHGH